MRTRALARGLPTNSDKAWLLRRAKQLEHEAVMLKKHAASAPVYRPYRQGRRPMHWAHPEVPGFWDVVRFSLMNGRPWNVAAGLKRARRTLFLLGHASSDLHMIRELQVPEFHGVDYRPHARCMESTTMKLYYLAGSCALAPHIALEHSRLDHEAIRIERGEQSSPSYLAINPLGRVPALVTASHGTITEVPAVLSYIADLVPNLGLLRGAGTWERYEALRWMAYLASTVHSALGRLWRPERFSTDAGCVSSVEQAAAAQLVRDFAHIDKQIADREWVAGTALSVADLHLFVFGRLGLRLTPSTREFPNFYRHTLSIAGLGATARAMVQQGIKLEGPRSGPG